MKTVPRDRLQNKRADTRKTHRAGISFDEWRAALEEANALKVVPIPAGWLSMTDYALQQAVSRSGATSQIKKLLAAGKVESDKFPVIQDGVARSIPHYRLKK